MSPYDNAFAATAGVFPRTHALELAIITLTKVTQGVEAPERDRPGKTKITRQMKQAGADALELWSDCCSGDELAERVYIAMEAVQLQACS